MNVNYWCDRWIRSETGFHQNDINPYLQRFWPGLNLAPGSRVLVPLCGKTRDMLWLRAQGHEVVGVEISPVAVEAFFSENSLPFSITQSGSFHLYQAEGFLLYCGDFFQVTPEDMHGVSAVYDRASLVALPPSMRNAYGTCMQAILAPGTKILLLTFDYPQHEMAGPPFSVQEPEVRALFGKAGDIQLLHSANILDKEPRYRDKGVTRLQEKVFLVTQREGRE